MSKPWQFKRQHVYLPHDDGDDAASVCSEVSDFDPSQISDPILQQQALRSQQDLRSGATARKHAPQTAALIDAMWKNWQLWAVSTDFDPVRLLRKGAKNSAVFMAFFQFYHDKHKVHRAESYKNYWKRVKQVYFRELQTEVPGKISGEVSNWFLNTFYSRNNIQRKRRDRQTLDHRSLFSALHYHWVYDMKVYAHERNRIQLATVLLWLAYTGVRPGSLILSSSLKEHDPEYTLGKRAIRYEDIDLYLLRTPGHEPVLAVQVRIIQQKGEAERSSPASVFSFFENRSCPLMCPIIPFLALAFSDNAFHPSLLEAGLAPNNLHSFSSGTGGQRMKFDWDKSMLKTPVFRATRRGLTGIEVDPKKPLNAASVRTWFESLCSQAGFEEGMCTYTIRRGVGTKLTDRGVASERRNQIMGHSRSSIFEQWYQDHKISVDVQSAFLEESSRPALMASLARQCLRLDPDLPRSLTREQREAAYATPQIRKLQKTVEVLSLELTNTWGSVIKGANNDPEKAGKRLKILGEIKSLREAASRAYLKKLKSDFHSEADLSAMIEQLQGKGMKKKFLVKPEYALSQRRTLSQLLDAENIGDARFAEAVERMTELSARKEEQSRLGVKRDLHDPAETGPELGTITESPPNLPVDPLAHAPMFQMPGKNEDSRAPAESYEAMSGPSTTLVDLKGSYDREGEPVPILKRGEVSSKRVQQWSTHKKKATQRKPYPARQSQGRGSTARRRTCLFCESKSDSPRIFANPSSLIRHYRFFHFSQVTGEFLCPVKDCERVIPHPDAFARHAYEAHGSDIGKRASLIEKQTARRPRQHIIVFE